MQVITTRGLLPPAAILIREHIVTDLTPMILTHLQDLHIHRLPIIHLRHIRRLHHLLPAAAAEAVVAAALAVAVAAAEGSDRVTRFQFNAFNLI